MPHQTVEAQARQEVGQPRAGLKWIKLDTRYKIQVPDNFTLGKISDKISPVPAFYFNARPPDHTSIQVFLLPKIGNYLIDPKTGRPHIEIDGTSLSRSFKIQGGIDVYYGWSVDDTAYECTMNSPCPAPVPSDRRYGTLYVFAVIDEAHDTIVEFRGDHLGPTQNVRTLKGDGRLLRYVIVPSLSLIR